MNECNETDPKLSEEFTLQSHTAGLYGESLVINGTPNDIVIVTSSGSRVMVHPDHTSMNGSVTVIRRCANGRLNDDVGLPMKLETKEYVISAEAIQRGYYFHKPTGTLIANREIGQTITHPYADKPYTDIINDIMKKVTGADCSSIRFTINDPQGRTNKLYGCVGDHCFAIPCTNVSKGGVTTAECVSFLHDGISATVQATHDVEELFTFGSIEIEAFDRLMVLGTSADDALTKYRQIKSDRENAAAQKVFSKLAEERKKLAEGIGYEKDKLTADIEKQKIEQGRLKNDLSEREAKIKKMQNELDAQSLLIERFKQQREDEAEAKKVRR